MSFFGPIAPRCRHCDGYNFDWHRCQDMEIDALRKRVEELEISLAIEETRYRNLAAHGGRIPKLEAVVEAARELEEMMDRHGWTSVDMPDGCGVPVTRISAALSALNENAPEEKPEPREPWDAGK